MSSKQPHPALQKPFDTFEGEILRRGWDRLNAEDRHLMVCLVGEEGIGKSETALRIASLIDSDFTAESVIFEAASLIERLKDGEYEQGQVFVLDEAGVSLGRRSWYDTDQIEINKSFQLIRSHNIGVIFTLPRLGELDSQTEARLQAFLELEKRVPGSHVEGKWKYIDPDRADSGSTNYKKYPRVYRDGHRIRVTQVGFRQWNNSIIDEYEERKAAHQQKVYEQALSDGDGSDGDSDETTPQDIANEIAQEGLSQYVAKHGHTNEPYINKDLIRANQNISHSKARAVKTLLEQTFNISQLEDLS